MHKRIGILAGMSPESTVAYEIPPLVSEADAGIPLLDTTSIHAEAALTYACETD
jgi:aspartate/glutamate racemase